MSGKIHYSPRDRVSGVSFQFDRFQVEGPSSQVTSQTPVHGLGDTRARVVCPPLEALSSVCLVQRADTAQLVLALPDVQSGIADLVFHVGPGVSEAYRKVWSKHPSVLVVCSNT